MQGHLPEAIHWLFEPYRLLLFINLFSERALSYGHCLSGIHSRPPLRRVARQHGAAAPASRSSF